MAKVLVNLVSQQRVPNVLAILDNYFSDVDRYIFITTEKMEKLIVVDDILECTGVAPDRCQKILVEENDLWGICAQLQKAKLDSRDHYLTNLTGGTKIMSLAVHTYFSREDWKVTHHYLPISANAIQEVSIDRPTREIPITFEIGVVEYLKSYGLKIEDSDFSVPKMPQAINFQVLNFFFDQRRRQEENDLFWKVTRILRGLRSLEVPIPIARVEGLEHFLTQFPFPLRQEGFLQRQEIQYLTGGWFEEFIYMAIKGQLELSDKAIGRNVIIDWFGVDHDEGKIELDVVFMYRNTIHVVECKTSLRAKKMTINEHFKRVLHQLAALRKEMGLRVKMALVTLDTHLREKDGQFKALYDARSKLFEVTVLDRTNLLADLTDYLNRL